MPTTITKVELDCSGDVRLGALSPETSARLASVGGEWLEYDPAERSLVVCHVQPGGSPTLSALPAELIAFLDSLTPEERDAVPGGNLLVRDRSGVVLRLVVEGPEIHVQWPREDWSKVEPVDLDSILATTDPFSSRISGRVRFTAPPGAGGELEELVANFEGLYPEGDLSVERDGGTVRVRFQNVNVDPEPLLARLRRLADPPESLEGELEVGSFLEHAMDRDFRITLRKGEAEAVLPSLWPDG